jgi:uncharacterized protein HemX
MTDFTDKLRLKEMAEEDIYFAKRDQELIRALHERKLAEHLEIDARKKKKKAADLQERYAKVTKKHRRDPWKLAERYRGLIEKALKLVKR